MCTVEKIELLAMHADSLAWPRAGPIEMMHEDVRHRFAIGQIKLDWVLQIEGWAEQWTRARAHHSAVQQRCGKITWMASFCGDRMRSRD